MKYVAYATTSTEFLGLNDPSAACVQLRIPVWNPIPTRTLTPKKKKKKREGEREGGREGERGGRERERERERERTANLHKNVRLISTLVFCDAILSNLHSARLFSRKVMIM